MFGWFKRKKEIEGIKQETKKGFDLVKKDLFTTVEWIKHLNSENKINKESFFELKEDLSSIHSEIENLKNIIDYINQSNFKQVFKTPNKLFKKQTGVYAVQTGVQTGVQTPKLEQFSITERAILWILLNTDMKLSYDDLASILGKEKSTIRGQLNTIKSKSDFIIKEIIEKNGKKRVFIPENIKEKLLKKTKVRLKNTKNKKKGVKISKY
jgi:predicted transcriptional regulator